MRTAAYLYPWDVDGDGAAADRIAGLRLAEVALAAAYHAVRAVTPHHPEHRIVTRDAAVYYRPDPAHWRGARLSPVVSRAGRPGRCHWPARCGSTTQAWPLPATCPPSAN